MSRKMIEGRRINLYYPDRGLATLSTTGAKCALNCAHCGGKYLRRMYDVSTPSKFRSVIGDLRNRGVEGVLLSGGCDGRGRVPFEHLADVIREMVRENDILINVHPGFVRKEDANKLRELGIENICPDVVGTSRVVRRIYGLDISDPAEHLCALKAAGFTSVTPHVTIGLDPGEPGHETKALELIDKCLDDPEKLVLLSLIPTKGTRLKDRSPPGPEDVIAVIGEARTGFPNTEIILGCMRSHYDTDTLLRMIETGLDGVVNPPRDLEARLEEAVERAVEKGRGELYGISALVKKESCCSF